MKLPIRNSQLFRPVLDAQGEPTVLDLYNARILFLGDALVGGPSSVKPRKRSSIGKAVPFTKRNGCFSDAAMRNQNIRSSVSTLLSWRCPFAVFRGVALRVVSSFYLKVFGWLKPEVIKKALKPTKLPVTKAPSFAHSNSPSSIRREAVGAIYMTSLDHRLPAPVFRRSGLSSTMRMLRRSGNKCLKRQASTAFFHGCFESADGRCAEVAAITNARPEGSAIHFPAWGDCDQSSKPESRKLFRHMV